jgi:hypothetical protein
VLIKLRELILSNKTILISNPLLATCLEIAESLNLILPKKKYGFYLPHYRTIRKSKNQTKFLGTMKKRRHLEAQSHPIIKQAGNEEEQSLLR